MRIFTYPCASFCAPSGVSSWYTLCRSPQRHTGELYVFANCHHSRVRRWGKRTHCAYRSAQQSYYWDSLPAVCGRPCNIRGESSISWKWSMHEQSTKIWKLLSARRILISFTFIRLHVLKELNFVTFHVKYIVIKKSLFTWWLQYIKLQVMFKVSPASLQTFTDTPNRVIEDRVQYNTVHIPKVFCDDRLGKWLKLFKIFLLVFCTVIIRCTETFWSPCICLYYDLSIFRHWSMCVLDFWDVLALSDRA
jgi:hypothetical protein